MRVMRLVVVGLAATISSAQFPPAPRQPLGPWRVDYGLAQCVAMREYGTDANPLTLVLKPSPNGGVMRILVVRKGRTEVAQVPAKLDLGGRRMDTNLLKYSDDKSRRQVAAINVPMPEFKASLPTPTLDIRSVSLTVTLALSAVDAMVGELDKCLVDLQQFWNVGERFKPRIAREAQPERPLNQLFSPYDYPRAAIDERQQGLVAMTFLIDEKGHIADCTVDQTSGVPVLDTMSCYVISRRARFAPAIGADGKPIRSAHETRVSWRIAGLKPPRQEDAPPR